VRLESRRLKSVRRLLLAWLFLTFGIAEAQGSFYSAADLDLANYANGQLIRSEPMAGAPDAATAYRILYRSEGLHGEPIAISGVVIVPSQRVNDAKGPIIAWAHPTTGVVPACAPSLARVFFESIPGLHEMLQEGYVVAATDYPGLGTLGPHPYLVGLSEGRAVLDSVRAARAMTNSGSAFAVWGHSQGGHAALYTGIMASDYAPELTLVGVAAAAPATDLAELLADDRGTSGGTNVTAMTLWSWSQIYGAPLANLVTRQGMAAMGSLADKCIERFFDVYTRRGPSKALARSFLKVNNLSDVEPWRGLLLANSPGTPPSTVPLFLAQGNDDTLVLPAVTQSYMQELCKAGNVVQWHPVDGVGHLFVARDSASSAVAWMGARFAGTPAPNDCR
jgi:acetyl esterase/lipase